MAFWEDLLGKVERFVLRRPILTVLILLLASTAGAVLIPGGDPNLGATIWLVTGGAAMIWRWTVLKEKHPGISAAPGLTEWASGWWRRLTRRDEPGD